MAVAKAAQLRYARLVLRHRAFWLTVLSLGLVFCSSDESDTGSVCEPGRQVSCACGNGSSSFQICRTDGSGYESCQCGDGGGGASGGGGAGAASGASGVSGASGSSGSIGDGGGSCPPGSATNITGSCDLVKQDCGGTLTCWLDQLDGGGMQSSCVALGSGQKQLGVACSAYSECAPGLTCAVGKCTRPCCTELEDAVCGSAGDCDMQVTFGSGSGAPFVTVCTFSALCTPWTSDCPPGPESDCHVAAGGKLKCSFPNYTPDAGSTVGQPCNWLNDCGDSQQCDYASGTGICRWLCKANAEGGAPDAGVVGGEPGNGGCLPGETCVAYSTPSWLGVCRPP